MQQVKSTSFPRLTLSLTLTEKLGRAKTQKFEKLKEGLILRGKLFEDPYFPANGKSGGGGGLLSRGRSRKYGVVVVVVVKGLKGAPIDSIVYDTYIQ